jgi:hypothetical protein
MQIKWATTCSQGYNGTINVKRTARREKMARQRLVRSNILKSLYHKDFKIV